MNPLIKKLSDFGLVLVVSAAISLAIIAVSNSLVAKATFWKSYQVWLSFVSRPDIIATTLLAIAVTMAVAAFQQSRGRRS